MANITPNKQAQQAIKNFWVAYNDVVACEGFKEALAEAAAADSAGLVELTSDEEKYYMEIMMMQNIIDAIQKG